MRRTRLLSWRVGCLLIAGLGACTLDGAEESITTESETIWTGADADIYTGDVSPDGRYFTDIDWDVGGLDLVDLSTGEARRLTDLGYASGRYAWTSSFSNDGTRLAVAWFVYDARAHELRIVDVAGATSRVLVPAGDPYYYVEPLDWSPDDAFVAVALQPMDGDWELGVVSVEDGTLRVVERLGWQTPGGAHPQSYPHASWSPDGRYLAFDYPTEPDGWPRDIYALALDGSERRTLLGGPGSDHVLGWSEDGSGLLFYSDRDGRPGVWRVEVEDGQASDEPRPVHPDLPGLVALDVTARGYVYGTASAFPRVHTARIDPESGDLLGEPVPVIGSETRRTAGGAWSPSGNALAHISFGSIPRPIETVVITSPDGEVLRSVPLPIWLHTKVGTVRWVREDTLLLHGTVRSRPGIFALALDTGEATRLPLDEEDGALQWYEPGPDGDRVYFVQGRRAIVSMDRHDGSLRVLAEAPALPASLAVSPDGRELAYLTRPDAEGVTALRAVVLETGEDRLLWHGPKGRVRSPVLWTASGRLLVGAASETGAMGLWIVTPGSADAPMIHLPCCAGDEVTVHPNGDRIAFLSGEGRGAIRVLEAW